MIISWKFSWLIVQMISLSERLEGWTNELFLVQWASMQSRTDLSNFGLPTLSLLVAWTTMMANVGGQIVQAQRFVKHARSQSPGQASLPSPTSKTYRDVLEYLTSKHENQMARYVSRLPSKKKSLQTDATCHSISILATNVFQKDVGVRSTLFFWSTSVWPCYRNTSPHCDEFTITLSDAFGRFRARGTPWKNNHDVLSQTQSAVRLCEKNFKEGKRFASWLQIPR